MLLPIGKSSEYGKRSTLCSDMVTNVNKKTIILNLTLQRVKPAYDFNSNVQGCEDDIFVNMAEV